MGVGSNYFRGGLGTTLPGGGRGGGLQVTISGHQFFNATTLKSAVNKAEHRYLRHAGGYTTRTAKNLIKKKGAARKPPKEFKSDGSRTKAWLKWRVEKQKRPASSAPLPPHTHSDDRVSLRRATQWGLSSGQQSVLIGPESFGPETTKIWNLHEFGGTRKLWLFRREHGVVLFTHHRSRYGRRGKTTAESFTARYEQRQFMGAPRGALGKVTPQLPKLWQDSVR